MRNVISFYKQFDIFYVKKVEHRRREFAMIDTERRKIMLNELNHVIDYIEDHLTDDLSLE
jgi:hypothetical protein